MVEIQENISLKEKTSFKIGGLASYFLVARNLDEVRAGLQFVHEQQITLWVFGGFTNVLLPDHDLAGLVMQLVADPTAGESSNFELRGGQLKVWAGEKTGQVAWQALYANLADWEMWTSLPGTIGGAIWNNSHYGLKFISDDLVAVDYLNLATQEIETKTHDELDFAYDHSWFQTHPSVILSANFRTRYRSPAIDKQTVINQAIEIVSKRKRTQPYDLPSAGCFWQNPPGKDGAGFLIDQAGLKGKQIGDAQVSEVHAAFIINLGNATSEDVRQLAAFVKQTVWEKFQLTLTPEVVIID